MEKFKEVKISKKELLEVYEQMYLGRVLEETMIKMSKSGEGFFWIGGPGEEAFNLALGRQILKGEGPRSDYLHLHYRSLAVVLAMGSKPIDSLRQMGCKSTDPYSGGRNFVNHVCIKEMNVVPVTSTIETQFSASIGTAIHQTKFKNNKALTLVVGGDAGTAEGDFATCLYWASNNSKPLPMLIVVTNNKYGISTPIDHVWGKDRAILDRVKGFGIESASVDGTDYWQSYAAIKKGMDYIRKNRKPFFIEAFVSRLHGHSSSSGANRIYDESDCISLFESRALRANVKESELESIRSRVLAQIESDLEVVRSEPYPDPATIYDHLFYEA